MQILDYEIKQHMGPELMEELEKKVTQCLLDESQNLISCKCGNIMQFEKGKVDYSVKDD